MSFSFTQKRERETKIEYCSKQQRHRFLKIRGVFCSHFWQNAPFPCSSERRGSLPEMGLPAVVVMKNPNERLAFSVSVRRGEQRWAGHASVIAILTKAVKPPPADCRKVSRRGKRQFFRARFYRSTKFRLSLILSLRESCWGVPSPNPAYAAYAA